MTEIISLAVDLFFIYMLIGFIFSFWFVFAGAKKIDDGMEGTPFHFKLILIPGSLFMWPIMLIKIIQK